MEQVQSALDLFRKYHMRYPRIDMGKVGFSGDITDAGRFYLAPTRDGKPLGHKTRQLSYPYIDVLRAGLDIQTGIRGSSGVDPYLQLQDAYWERIRAEFIDGRRFSVHVYEPYFPRWYNVSLRDRAEFPAQFRIWPALKRGMVINPEDQGQRSYLHWSAFVPAGTPEHDAIRASLDLAERANDGPIKPSAEEIAGLQAILREKIALVPA